MAVNTDVSDESQQLEVSVQLLQKAADLGVSVEEVLEMYRVEESRDACTLAHLGNERRLRQSVTRDTVDSAYQGWTPLMMAAAAPANRGLACARLLLLLGADPCACDAAGRTAFHYAALLNNAKVLRLLQRHSLIFPVTRTGQTPLMWAAAVNSVNSVRILANNAAQGDAKDFAGRTAFDLAKQFESWSSLLVIADAVNCQTFTWNEKLHFMEREKTARELCHLSIIGDSHRLSRVVTSSNCNSRWLSRTPLMWCSSAKSSVSCVQCLQTLLNSGADCTATDWEGCTAMHTAAEFGNLPAITHLHRHVGVNAADEDGWTPLMRAAVAGDKATVEHLVRLGASVNVRDMDGNLAMSHAESGGFWNVVGQLVHHMEPL